MRAAPLAGLRVLDLTRLLPGPLATQHLADYGADVIKVEDTGAGDYARCLGPMCGDTSYLYRLVNRGKRSIRLDLKQPAGRELLLRLADDADVLVEGFRPGVMDKLGLGYAVLAERNPRLVYCSISGYGQDGPYAQRAGHDINYIGYAGVLDQIGAAGAAPALANLQIGDLLGGTLSSLVGMLVAVIDARTSGRGRHVDVSMTDAVLAHAIFPLAEVLAHGAVKPRGEDLLTGGVPCYGVYETADGRYMAVGALEEKFWHRVCEALGRADLKPAHLASGELGARARAELAAIFRSRTQAEWTAVFDPIDCCVTPVLPMQESLSDPQLVARGMIVEVDGVTQFGPPVRLSDYAPASFSPAPAAGAHTEQVLAELGVDADELARLRAAQVI
ncbi:MAG TPA: CaiB/BaiF CoA-transferase family protein [Pseudothauera hydrothermalis]|jgi:crotonobetainyl-CoA:carnitine CoA-transferase CaiB-like acyl-CoA transferase|uniref:CaiB/BaiF CoA transferase family protein n=1 Tax=Pseudothauera hydrothermalis TaxID=2184083 RepID=UPI000C7CF8AE|nr:CaiB/BaiF CoA-transferase family protein [Pseudothauera hydrothermalis]AUL99103.1 carnitine dehydratase [Rhodocyclaceae bacterium]AVZ78325.1 CoA transferase [Zoogloeaceae bacteirum Par-f-2]HNQ76717.1 CaiB/BaiF CoA-transferase family protein [Pseudothauera hydrothermalis]